jgi:hypothetical protein
MIINCIINVCVDESHDLHRIVTIHRKDDSSQNPFVADLMSLNLSKPSFQKLFTTKLTQFSCSDQKFDWIFSFEMVLR